MSTIAYARIVREELEERVKSVEEGILNGVNTIDEYRFLVGKRLGLQSALATLDDVTKRFDEAQ